MRCKYLSMIEMVVLIVFYLIISVSLSSAEEQTQIMNELSLSAEITPSPGSNEIVDQECTTRGVVITASKSVEVEVVDTAENKLYFFLQSIREGDHEKYGFKTRDELDAAVIGGQPYQMYRRCKSSDYPTNVWRVPVLVQLEIRAFITVDWVDNSWQAVEFGATELAELISSLDKKIIREKNLHENINLHRVIIRDRQNTTDYLHIKAYSVEGALLKTILSFPEVIQEQNEWCWVGVSAALFDYFDNRVEQCEIAEYTRTAATWHDFGSEDCCISPSGDCNYWNYNYGYTGSIEDILESMQNRINIQNYGIANKLTISQVESDLSQDRPFIIRWAWDSGGGHFVVGFGIDDNPDDVDNPVLHYMDPWFGEGNKISFYDWVSLGGGHSWTHTNRVTDVFMFGDIDGSRHIDLVDLIISLQLTTGSDNSNVEMFSDVNNDDKLGIPEAIYILGRMSD